MNHNSTGSGPWHCVDIAAHVAAKGGDVAEGLQAAIDELNELAPNVDQLAYIDEFKHILVHRRS